MPSLITHALFGDMVAKELPQPLQEQITGNFSAYSWGLQGPDFLYFRGALQGGHPLNEFGKRLHKEKTQPFLEGVARYCISRKNKADEQRVLAYYMGLLCHYAADTTVHPYVYWLTNRMERALPPRYHHSLHHTVESDMDATLYRVLCFRPVRKFDFARRAALPADLSASIALLYTAIAKEVYQMDVLAGEFAIALREARKLGRWMPDPTAGVVTGVVQVGESLLGVPGKLSGHFKKETGMDVLNLAGIRWENPASPEETHTDTVPMLLQQAKALALELIEQADSGIKAGKPQLRPGLKTFNEGATGE